MAEKVLKLKNLERRNISYHGSTENGVESAIMKYFIVNPKASNCELHEIPSAGIFVHPLPITRLEEVILTLEKRGTGWYSVRMLTNPLLASIEIFNSKTGLVNTSPYLRWIHANRTYRKIRNVLEKGDYKIHRFHDGAVGFEETA
jgi:hypothetical protein